MHGWRRRIAVLPAVLVAALVTAACDVNVGNGDFSIDVVSGKAQDEWSRSYDIKPGTRIQIVNINGKIVVEPGGDGKFAVRAQRLVKARTDETAREMLGKLEILETNEDGRVRLETKPGERPRMGQSIEVRYFLTVPVGSDLDLKTVNGGVEVTGVKGALTATTTNGGVKGFGLSGPVEASTTNGGVELDFASVSADVKLETVNGGVRVMLPESAKADILARCVNGGIGVDNLKLDTVNGERSRRKLEGTMNGGGPKIRIDTTNGGIRITGRSES
jgi:Toastrack DUF4097